MEADAGKSVARSWLRGEQREGRRASWPVVLFGAAGIAAAVAQAWLAAGLLGQALSGHLNAVWPRVLGFTALALLRASFSFAAERAAFNAGAAARRRLRTDALSRVLHSGPKQLRAQHTGELTATVVDRVEAVDGLHSRWLPALTLAFIGPAMVALAALLAEPVAALVLVLCGLLVPLGMAAAGVGAAAASRSQF